MKASLLIAFLQVGALEALCANVEWNTAFVDVYPDYGGVYDANVALGAPPYLPMGGRQLQGGWELFAIADTFMEYANTFVLSSAGDVVGRDYMENQEAYFLYSEYGMPDSGRSDYSISLLMDAPVYLAFENETALGSTYGWVQLGVDPVGGIEVLASCWNRDGQAVVVGQAPIPEPNSVVLLLMGLSMVGLRRLGGRHHPSVPRRM